MSDLIVKREDVFEDENFLFVWERDAREFAPNHEWPTSVKTELGNKLPFVMSRTEVLAGDVIWIDYRQEFGCITLRVFND